MVQEHYPIAQRDRDTERNKDTKTQTTDSQTEFAKLYREVARIPSVELCQMITAHASAAHDQN